MSTDAPIKINQMTRGDNRYYHLRSHRIHPQSMDMFESRISFALDNKDVIEKIDSDENAKNNFMDVLVGIKEEILSQEAKENKDARKIQFDNMTKMLTSGKVNDLSLKEKENIVII